MGQDQVNLSDIWLVSHIWYYDQSNFEKINSAMIWLLFENATYISFYIIFVNHKNIIKKVYFFLEGRLLGTKKT